MGNIKRFTFWALLVFAFIAAAACMRDFPAPQNDPDAPSVSVDAESLTRISATLNGTLPDAQDIVSYGFEMTGTNFDDSPDLVVEVTDRDEEGRFSYTAEVTPGAFYSVRSFISNGHDKKYSGEVSLKVPLTSAATPSEVTIVNNKLVSSIVDDGGRTVREVGFCWSESSDKKVIRRNRFQAVRSEDGSFTAELPAMEKGCTYYFLAYVENATGSQEVFGYSTTPYPYLMKDEERFVSIEDEMFFRYLVNLYDKNKDGGLSEKELQDVTSIEVNTDQIASIQGIEWMPALHTLVCQGSSPGKGRLHKVDISRNPKLTRLDCSGNQLTELNVSSCFRLEELNCSDNQLTGLDLSKNPYLGQLFIRKNPLETIDISLCTELERFDGTDCPDLERVYVAPDRYEDIVKDDNFSIDGTAEFYPIFIPIQDPTLHEYLLSVYDGDGDRRISAFEADGVTKIDICTNDVLTMAGIEFFYNLEDLSCGSCFNVNQNANRGQLTELDVSHNRKLTFLDCHGNRIARLDLSRNEALTTLLCDGNQLTELDCSHNPRLEWISCDEQRISSLNVSECKELKSLLCPSNKLESLDVTRLTLLENLRCNYNQLTELDVSQNRWLTTLWCESNQLEWLDVTKNEQLKDLRCDNVYIPDEYFKDYLLSEYDTDDDGEISLAEAWLITGINVSTHDIYTLDGIQSFLNLQWLACDGRSEMEDDDYGQLTELDLSRNTKLRSLDCRYNMISSLDLSHNTALWDLTCIGNNISSLELACLPELRSLDCALNPISSLDISHNPELFYLHCQYMQVKELDLSHNSNLEQVYCSNNALTTLNLANNPKLTILECSTTGIFELDLSNNVNLQRLDVQGTFISSLNVSNNPALKYLDCRWNQMFWELIMKTGQEIETLLLDTQDISIIYI